MKRKQLIRKRKRSNRRRNSSARLENRPRESYRRLGLECLENRLLLSANAGWSASLDLASLGLDRSSSPFGLNGWTVETGTRNFSEVHRSSQGDFEFVWEPEVEALSVLASIENLSLPAAAPLPISQLPALNSNLGAPVDIYIDVNGNYQETWGIYSNATTPVYDSDGDPTTYSETELANIVTAYNILAEDFAPFNVNVTTVEPAVLADGVPENQADGVALRIAIGGSSLDWYGSSAGGVGYVNSFTSSIANVVYVFGNGTFGETAAHEVGHALGLQHQSLYDSSGVKVEEYYSGSSDWNPIMGGGSSATSTWYNGTSTSATTYQDDLAILSGTTNGFGYQADDHGDATGSATSLSYDGVYWTGAGIIETNVDVDVFQISPIANGEYLLRVDVDSTSPNLDAVLELRNSVGSVVATASPSDEKGVEVVADLTAGEDYYLHVTKTSSYGYVGQYSVTVLEVAPGPRIVFANANGSVDGPIDGEFTSIRVTFVEPIDAATFGVDDLQLTGPRGPVTITGVAPVAGLGNTQFDILFDTLSTAGFYDLAVIPTIADLAGNEMNQDQDEFAGETDEDGYAERFIITVPGSSFLLSGTGTVYARDLEIDEDGYIYVAGILSSTGATVDVDPGPGTTLLTSAAYSDTFIAKYTPSYELVWVSQVSSDGLVYTYDLELDSSRNVYATGYFSLSAEPATATFGPFTLTSQGKSDAFLTKLDADGNFLWAKSWGGTESDYAYSLALAPDGEVHVAGNFRDTVDFDPSTSVYNLTSTDSSLDGYLAQFDGNGNFVTAVAFSGPGSDYARDLVTDSQDNLYVAGYFYETIQLGPGVTLQSIDNRDTFVAKLNLDYEVQWVQQISGPSGITNSEVAVDDEGNVYASAYFSDTVDFGVGTPTFTNSGGRDAVIAKWNATGDFQWAQQIDGGESNLQPTEIDVDDSSNVFLTGYFGGTADFGFSPEGVSLTSVGTQDDFLLSLDENGNFRFVYQVERHNNGWIRAMDVGPRGNVYLAGDFTEYAVLPNGDQYSIDEGIRELYILKLNLAPGITVAPSLGLTTTEIGGTANFSFVLDTAPTADVMIGLASSNSSEGTVSPTSLTFTPSNWDQPQLVIVTGADDTLLDGDVAYSIITGVATSADPGYQGLNPADVTVTNLDNDQPVVLFADSFENGQWNGKWVEDSQNDWFTSTQRSTDGNYSAEVDGRSSNATLTTANPIDLTLYGTVELSFSWYIENRLDSGEYLALDLYNGSWQNDVAILRGNVDQENVWHQETIAVDGSYLVDNFQFRFRSKASRSNEDANVDNVSLVATSLAAPPNALPVAVADAYSVAEDGTLSVLAAAGLLVNDSDADGDPLTAVLASGPANGALSLNADGSFAYTPNPNFSGSDSFSYRANDGTVDSNTATVAITVNSINDAPVASADSYTIDQNTPLNVTAAGVLANDSDADGDGLTAVLVVASGPQNGTLSLSADGSFSYTPNAGFNGSDSFSYRANDGALDSNTATVSITVNRVNQLPVATAEAYSTAEDTPLNVSAPGVLTGDTDADGDPLTAVLASWPSSGALTLNSNGSFTYTPAANFNGSDSFSYVANDGIGNSNVATVGITVNSVNDLPVAVGDNYNVAEDGTLNVAIAGVLTNDTDADGNSLTAALISSTANGSLAFNTDGSFTYTPAANFNGNDSFVYETSDGQGGTAQAIASIQVAAVNDVPVAEGQVLATSEDTSLAITLTGSDLDGDSLTYAITGGPDFGTLSGTGANRTYTPAANYNGPDSFSFAVHDGTIASTAVIVSITIDPVNDAPVAVADAYTVDQDTILNIAATGILANDTDVEGDLLTAVQVTGTANGVLSLNLDGSFDYTPNAGFTGIDSFTYLANDGAMNSSAAAQVTFDVQAVASGPKLANGIVTGVGSNWQTVNLSQTYTSMVVIATPNYAAGDAPAVVRIQNAVGSSFEVRVDGAGGGAVGNVGVNYVVVEEGVYDQPGYKLEAVKYNSTVTDENNSWTGESRSYQQSYTAPVVVGQVMTYNDADWSTFWAAGSSRKAAPSSTALTVGKHVGEDADVTRANETIGYLVIETSTDGSGQIEGLPFVAGVGADSIKGVGDAPGYSYGIPASLNAQTAVVSQAAMDGGNGGWAVLYGSNPVDSVGNTLNLAIDEDQAKDTERRHTTEQVAYLVFGTPAASPSAGPVADQAFTITPDTTPDSPKREPTPVSIQDRIFSLIEFHRGSTQLSQPAHHFQHRLRAEPARALEAVVDDTEAFVEAIDRAFETAFGSR